MTDTHPKIQAIYDFLTAQKTGTERVAAGLSMLAFAKEIALSSIKASEPDLTPKELRKKLFLRLYSNDFNQEQITAILAQL